MEQTYTCFYKELHMSSPTMSDTSAFGLTLSLGLCPCGLYQSCKLCEVLERNRRMLKALTKDVDASGYLYLFTLGYTISKIPQRIFHAFLRGLGTAIWSTGCWEWEHVQVIRA
jgi:hypothetical protein